MFKEDLTRITLKFKRVQHKLHITNISVKIFNGIKHLQTSFLNIKTLNIKHVLLFMCKTRGIQMMWMLLLISLREAVSYIGQQLI